MAEVLAPAAPTDGDNATPRKGTWALLRENPYLFGLSAVSEEDWTHDRTLADMCVLQFASLGGFLFGYDQGAVSGILVMESFAVHFPGIFLDSSFKGWFVSTLLLTAWFGSLINGAIADRLGRKGSIFISVVVFLIGCVFQTWAYGIAMLFAGECF